MSDDLPFPRSHAFIIGNNNYQHTSKLKTAVKDAQDIAKLLKKEHHYEVETLYDATKNQMEDMFTKMAEKVNPEDRMIVYFAGHGMAFDNDTDPEGYLVPVDAERKGREKLVSMKVLNQALYCPDPANKDKKVSICKHGLLILDCCFAGSFKWSTGYRSLFMDDEEDELYEERFLRFVDHPAWQVITSSAFDQKALDVLSFDTLGMRDNDLFEGIQEGENSPFASALIQAINRKGRADVIRGRRGDGVITATELYLYIRELVETASEGQGSRQSPAFFHLSKHNTKGEFIFLHPTHPLNLRKAPPFPNPYRGLSAYGQEKGDAKYFFGRRKEVKEMERRLLQNSILLVSAPSGQGKSSVVKASLIPSLLQKPHYAPSEFNVLRPGNCDPKSWEVLDEITSNQHRVILIDQYEEMFTEAEELRVGFETQLCALIEQIQAHPGNVSPLKLIFTMRSDFEWQLKRSSVGQSFWDDKQLSIFRYHLPKMSRNDLHEVMVRPAALTAYEFESDKLTNQILTEIQDAPGALPLLSFTLYQLYEMRDREKRLLTLNAYDRLNGVSGALSMHADRVYEHLSKAQKDVMQKLFLRMVQLNDGSDRKRRVHLGDQRRNLDLPDNELDYPDHEKETVEEVLEILESQLILLDQSGKELEKIPTQLIVRGNDLFGAYVEPMHDSLINHWEKCRHWIEDFGREHLGLQRDIWKAVRERHGFSQQAEQAFYWDRNPKLLQIIRRIVQSSFVDEYAASLKNRIAAFIEDLEGEDRVSFGSLMEEWETSSQMPNLDQFILSGTSVKILQLLIDQGNHWLNQAEATFILESWQKRTHDILNLKKQRDEAIAESRRTARLARANSNAILALQTAKTEPSKALRLAEMNYHLYPEAESSSGILRELLAAPMQGYCWQSFENGHTARVGAVAFSPDGAHILTGSYDKTAKLWDLTGAHKQSFEGVNGHKAGIVSLAFSEDGQYVVTGSEDETAKLWKLDGTFIRSFVGHEKSITSIVCSPIGREMQILTGSEDGTVRLWDKDQGKAPKIFKGIAALAFSPDGQSILIGCSDGTAQFWMLDQAQAPKIIENEMRDLSSGVLSPDGQQILTWRNKTMYLWDLTGKLVQSFNGHTDWISSAAFSPLNSPYGPYVLSGSQDKTIRLWNLNGENVKSFHDHIYGADSLVFSPDGEYIVSAGGLDYSAKLWKVASSNEHSDEIPSYEDNTKLISSVVASPNGKYMLTACWDQTAKLWDLETGKQVQSFEGHMDKVTSAIFSTDGQFVLTVSKDKTAKLWDLSGNPLLSIEGHSVGLNSIAISENGHVLTGGGEGEKGEVKLWALGDDPQKKTVKELRSFEGHSGKISSVAISFDGQQILTGGSWDTTVKLWRKDQNEAIRTFEGHGGSVNSVALSPDGQYILSGSEDETVKLWHKDQDEEVWTYTGHNRAVTSVAFSPDGEWILTGSRDQKAKLLDLAGKEGDLPSFAHNSTEIMSVAFSHNGKQVLTGTDAGWTKVWDADLGGAKEQRKPKHLFENFSQTIHSIAFSSATNKEQVLYGTWDHTAILKDKDGQIVHSFQGHSAKITAVAFSSDRQHVLTGSADKTAKLWTSQTGELIETFEGHNLGLTAVAFSSDDQYILTGAGPDFYDKGEVKLWNLSGMELQAYEGHTLGVRSVAFSPDGQQVLSGAGNYSSGEAKLWTLDGQALQTFGGDMKGISSISFTSNGQYILTGGENRKAKLWDLYGREIQSFESQAYYGELSFVFSADEQYILAIRRNRFFEKEVDRWLSPWALLNQQVQRYSLDELSILGLTYLEEEVHMMENKRNGDVW